jgi:hypothetical protein
MPAKHSRSGCSSIVPPASAAPLACLVSQEHARYRSAVVPYITAWSGEDGPSPTVLAQPLTGIGYLDETPADRDHHGVLWRRVPSKLGDGRPKFGEIHTARQQHAMRNLLCQVCAGPADQTENGTLWLLKDHRRDWAGWPVGMGVTEPPVCLPCAHLSRRSCPALRKGHVALRVSDCPIAGGTAAATNRDCCTPPPPSAPTTAS